MTGSTSARAISVRLTLAVTAVGPYIRGVTDGGPMELSTHIEETRIAEGFLEVVDVFADLIDKDRFVTVLLRCADVSRVQDGAILLSNAQGGLDVVVASGGAVLSLTGTRPMVSRGSISTCIGDGVPVISEFRPADVPFDPFVGEALNLGFHHEYAFPVSFRGKVLGLVLLLDRNEVPIDPWRADVTGSLAQTTGAMIHHSRANDHLTTLVGQLHAALDARVVIEQAKGVLAERNGHDLDAAFRVLRLKARAERRPIIDVAREIVPRH